MATSCNAFRTLLARQTPIYSETFLRDFISDLTTAPFLGRHQTKPWTWNTDQLFFNKVHVGQADYTASWSVMSSAECGSDPCNPPNTFVGWGTTQDSVVQEQISIRTVGQCIQQLLRVPDVGAQMNMIYSDVRKIPLGFTNDFVRTRVVSQNDTLQICGNAFSTFTITAANTARNLVTINLGSSANLPTSQLTWTYLRYQSQVLGMNGYDVESGLSMGMRNIVTHPMTWDNLTTQNPEIKSMLHLEGVKDVSPLYKLHSGISADPFGPYAPTFDNSQLRFQHVGNGLMNRVLPYRNDPATTGEKPVINPSYLNARYAISTVMHPKATTLLTALGGKPHEMLPTVNSSMYGKWELINTNPIIWYNADGTSCTKDNPYHYYFYWIAPLQLGLKYDYRNLIMPILHLIDGSGSACMVDSPVCGSAVQYTAQDYSDNPAQCEV